MSSNEPNDQSTRKSMFGNVKSDKDYEISNDSENQIKKTKIAEEVDRRKAEQNFSMAIVGGLLASLACIFIWATITVVTQWQIAYMAIGVGFAVGFSIQKFGKGISIKYGILGAIISLLTCVLGNLISYICLFANNHADYTYIQAFSNIDFETASYIMFFNFSFMDLFFYGIALYCGFLFSYNKD